MSFTDMLSLHLVAFLMFLILVEIFCTQCSTYNASVVDHVWVGLYTELGTFCAIPAHIELKWPRMLKKVVKNVRSAPKHHPKDESVLEGEIKKNTRSHLHKADGGC